MFMMRMLGIFIAGVFVSVSAGGTTTRAGAAARNTAAARSAGAATNTTGYNYNYMYPYMNNQMRTAMNPGADTATTSNPINTVVRVSNNDTRRVVARPRAAARAATTPATATSGRRVVPRASTPGATARAAVRGQSQSGARVVARAGRSDVSTTAVRSANGVIANTGTTGNISSARCMTDYTECMNKYCERANTIYNKCYCSAKLSQIDATYRDDINELVAQIIAIKNGANQIDADDINEYWMGTVGKYYGENSWTNVDSALGTIDWATMESRVRGQNAFATGHEYCAQHLRGCFYMASNMRDAYRSEIARDCATYESVLQRIKVAAETVIATYGDD